MKTTLCIFLFAFLSLNAQNKPLNNHLTQFQYPYSEKVEGGGVFFSKETTNQILKKPHKLVKLYGNYSKGYCWLDYNSITVIGDSLYCHLYDTQPEYLGKDKNNKDVFNERLCLFYPVILNTNVYGPFYQEIENILSIYQSTLKKKGKK